VKGEAEGEEEEEEEEDIHHYLLRSIQCSGIGALVLRFRLFRVRNSAVAIHSCHPPRLEILKHLHEAEGHAIKYI